MNSYFRLFAAALTLCLAISSLSQAQGRRMDVDEPGYEPKADEEQLPPEFQRQLVFFRSTEAPGTVVVNTSERFLYLVQPNSVALRYGIGIGGQCADLIGLRHIASMVEWPAWEAPRDTLTQKLAQSGTPAGAPGNPLGARVLELDDNRSRIHGTNAPKTIGTDVAFGCIRLVNDDIIDLYGRVRVGTPVLVN